MKTKKEFLTSILASLGMIILILDARTALQGATEGVALCIQTVIPSLLPFFVFSIWLTDSLNGKAIPLFSPLCRLFRIPKGAEGLLLVGFLGGYPVGAQCIAQSERNGRISSNAAKRMLAFGSNAGPAFLFGIGASVFSQMWMCWLLWGVHILSACIVAWLTPGQPEDVSSSSEHNPISFSDALRKSLEVMAMVCGWVILFRVLITFAKRWFLWLLPQNAQLLIFGLLELANGCIALENVENMGLRFTLFSTLLGFGGLCVSMQTFSVTQGVDHSWYLPGKLCQSAVSVLLCVPIQGLFAQEGRWEASLTTILFCLVICAAYGNLTRKSQKTVAFPSGLRYNEENLHKRYSLCYFEKRPKKCVPTASIAPPWTKTP